MTTKEISLAALLAFAAAGNVYLLMDKQTYVADVKEAAPTKVELTGEVGETVLAQAQQAGAVGEIKCRRGVISNAPDRLYCTDGKTAGWLVDEDKAVDLEAVAAKQDGDVDLVLNGGKIEVAP